VQCARKTEVSKWEYFFSVVGDPKNLFEESVAKGKLGTAASYLIILQSLASPLASREYASRLVVHALDGEQWELVGDPHAAPVVHIMTHACRLSCQVTHSILTRVRWRIPF
jgi:hypothetical protein